MIFVALTILGLTVSLALAQPTVGRLRIPHPAAAAIGAALSLAIGLVSPADVVDTMRRLALPLLTIVSLMVMTLVAEQAGLLRRLAAAMAMRARGSGRRLFVLVFLGGALTGALFTNDAAVLIFTPLVCALVDEVRGDDWKPGSDLPFYFAVLYVGNLVGPLVISNPINIIVAGFFGIGFAEYASWMLLPAAISMAVSLFGLWVFFRDVIPKSCRRPTAEAVVDAELARPCLWIIAATLLGFFSEGWTGVPVWAVATIGAAVSTALAIARGYSPRVVLSGVGWDVLIFVSGIFIVVHGLRNVGLTDLLGDAIVALSGEGMTALAFTTAIVAGVCSSIMNNHPTAGLMTWVIRDFQLPPLETDLLVYAALIGGDLGPKMLPVGSLAALLWFRILRARGIDVPYALYVRIGIPVTLAAIVASVAALLLQVQWMR